jgi:hypothetical protein
MPAIDLQNVDVILRADAGTGLPACLDRLLIEPTDQAARPLLLVDLDDRQDREFRHRSQKRQREYDKRGWFPTGTSPTLGRLKQFLRRGEV